MRKVALVLLSAALAALVVRESSHPMSLTFAAAAVLASLGAFRYLRLRPVAGGAWLAAYLVSLSLGSSGFDVLAPVFGVGLYLSVEVMEHGDVASRTAVSRQVYLGRAAFILGAVAAGGTVAVAAAWFGGAVRIAGPAAIAVSGALGLIVLVMVLAIAARALEEA